MLDKLHCPLNSTHGKGSHFPYALISDQFQTSVGKLKGTHNIGFLLFGYVLADFHC